MDDIMNPMETRRSRWRSSHACVWLLPLVLLAGCDSAEKSSGATDGEATGGTSGTSGTATSTTTDTGADLCGDTTTTVWTDLDATPAGFDRSITDMLAGIGGEYAGSFAWHSMDGPVQVTHAGTSSDLTVSLSHDGGEVRLVEVEKAGTYPGTDGGIPCSNWVEVDVSLSFVTADGVLAETWTAPLRFEAYLGDAPGALYERLDPAGLQGTLAASDFELAEGSTLSGLILSGSFYGDATAQGSLVVEVDLDSGGLGAFAMADWQAAVP